MTPPTAGGPTVQYAARATTTAARPRAAATPLAWGAAAFALALAAGIVVLRVAGTASGNELSFDRAVFAAVNALTLTGFQSTMSVDRFTPTGQLAVLVLTVAGTLVSLIVGGTAVARLLRLPYGDGRIAAAAAALTLLAALLGGVVLLSPATDLTDAVQQGLGAFGNSGLYTGALPAATSAATLLLLLPLATLGGLGITVLLELWDRARGRHCLTRHAQAALWMTAGVYLVATAAAFLAGGTPAAASAAVLNARTLGLPFATAPEASRIVPWVVAVVMLIGASPGGTGGGIKTTTLVALWAGVRRTLRGERPGRVVAVAAVWVAAYAAVTFAAFLALLVTEPQAPADQLALLAVSAASNVGLAPDAVSIVGPGLFVLSATMLLGRVLPMAVLWWAAATVADADYAVG